MYNEATTQIQEVIQLYFDGIFFGNTSKLSQVFVPEALLYGDIKGAAYLKSVDEYLKGVQNRKSPHEMGESFGMEVLSVDILGNMAIVRAHVPMLGYNYYDFLSLSIIKGQWKIVNKLFTHVE